METGTNNLDVRRHNKQAVLKLLYRQRKSTRKEVAEKLGLSFPTVTQLMKELQEDGLVEVVGQNESTGGRRAFLNAIVSNSRASVGVSVSMSNTMLVLLNMGLNVVERIEYSMPFANSPGYWSWLSEQVNELLERNEIPAKSVLGIGISFPGIVSSIGDSLEFAPTLDVDEIEFSRVKPYFSYDLVFGNDATLAAKAESWFKPTATKSVYLLLNRGVGGAFIGEENGLFGSRSGEFGHMVIKEDGKLCSCGRRGCFETYCSSSVLVDESGKEDLDEFFKALDAGDENCQAIWQDYFKHLVTGLSNIRSIFDTDIIIGGEMTKYLEQYSTQLRQALISNSMLKEDGKYLHFSNYGKFDAAIGAALINIDNFLSMT